MCYSEREFKPNSCLAGHAISLDFFHYSVKHFMMFFSSKEIICETQFLLLKLSKRKTRKHLMYNEKEHVNGEGDGDGEGNNKIISESHISVKGKYS